MPQKPNPAPMPPPPFDRNSTAHISFLKLWMKNVLGVLMICLFVGVVVGLIGLFGWSMAHENFVVAGTMVVLAILGGTGYAAWVEKNGD